MGPYCKYCDQRCFIPNPKQGQQVTILATCARGMERDRAELGYDIDQARAEVARQKWEAEQLPDLRTISGMRSSTNLLDALVRNDGPAAQQILDDCDAGPTLFGLASAWLTIVNMQGMDAADLVRQMQSTTDLLEAQGAWNV